jgi:hypothetical protein
MQVQQQANEQTNEQAQTHAQPGLNGGDLLLRFIDAKDASYVPPPPQRYTEGERAGFSKAKFRVCLGSLTTLPQKELGKLNGVSHGVVRQWFCESVFREQAAELREEFAQSFVAHIESLEGQDGGPTADQLAHIWGEAGLYSAEVLVEIMHQARQRRDTSFEQTYFSMQVFLFYVREIIRRQEVRGPAKGTVLHLMNEHLHTVGAFAKEHVRRMELPPKQKQGLAIALETILGLSDDMQHLLRGNASKEEETGDGK